MGHKVMPVLVAALIVLVGCNSVNRKILNESIYLPPEYWTVHHNFPYDRFGYSGGKLDIWEGLKILRIGMLQGKGEFVFEIQAAGDLSIAKKFYGASLQFDIDFYDKSQLLICTANGLEKAVLIHGDKSKLVTYVDKEDQIKEIKHESNFKFISDLKLEIDRDILRIHLPYDLIDEGVKDAWITDGSKLTWGVTERLALKKFKPVKTKIPGVYFIPEIFTRWHPRGESIYEKMLYGVEKEE
jgi:hypothetical protein